MQVAAKKIKSGRKSAAEADMRSICVIDKISSDVERRAGLSAVAEPLFSGFSVSSIMLFC